MDEGFSDVYHGISDTFTYISESQNLYIYICCQLVFAYFIPRIRAAKNIFLCFCGPGTFGNSHYIMQTIFAGHDVLKRSIGFFNQSGESID